MHNSGWQPSSGIILIMTLLGDKCINVWQAKVQNSGYKPAGDRDTKIMQLCKCSDYNIFNVRFILIEK